VISAAYARRGRPARYALAVLVTALLVAVITATSILNYFFLDKVAGRTSLYGLVTVALIGAASWIGVRAFDRDQALRRKHLIRAGVLLGLGILFWLLLIDVFVFTQEAGPGVALYCALACVPTTAFGLFVVRRLDRNEKEPWRLVLVATAWGAIVATSLVIWGEGLWDAIAVSTLVPGPGLDASNAFSAGILEELAKGTAVLLLFLVMRDEFDDVVDGIVYGAAVGLGFNFMESIAYMTNLYALFAPDGAGAAGAQWYFRQVLGLFFGHAAYTALIGAGFGIARQLPGALPKGLAIGSGWLIAIAAHFSWDAWLTFFPIPDDVIGILVGVHLRTLLMTGPFVLAVALLLVVGLAVEGAALRRHLQAEAETGLGAVLPEEVGELASPWRRFLARERAAERAGLGAYFRLARLQAAQLDLAMERWHRERKEIEAPLQAEDELRRGVLELKAQVEPRPLPTNR